MSFNHLLNINLKQANKAAMLDDLSSVANKAKESLTDDLDEKALSHAIYDIRQKAVVVVLNLAENILDSDLDDDETPTERLEALVSEFVDSDDDLIMSALYANMQDVMVSLGVAESIAEEALYSDDPQLQDEAIETMADLVNSNVPDDEDFDEWQKEFIYAEPDEFASDDEAEQLDSVQDSAEPNRAFDKRKAMVGKTTTKTTKRGTIIYKGVKAIRNGKLAVVNKRVGGDYRPTLKQRAAMKRLAKFAKTKKAIEKRVKAFKLGRKMGLHSK